MGAFTQHRDESGIALIYALLVAIIVGGLVTVVVARSITEIDASDRELDYEDTFHVAETGAEVFAQGLQTAIDTDSGILGPAAGSDRDAQRAWAIAQAIAAPAADVIDVGEGEAVGLRPVGVFNQFVYGVGFTPTRADFVAGTNQPSVRVLRYEVGEQEQNTAGNFAVLTEGPIKLTGNVEVTGTLGAVHTNSASTVTGSNVEIKRGLTYSDTSNGSSGTPSCDTDVAPCAEFAAPQPIPTVAATNLWGTHDALAVPALQWFEFCDGTWRYRGSSPTACDGSLVTAPALNAVTSRWNVKNPTMTLTGNGSLNAVYYIADPGGREVVVGDLSDGDQFTVITTGTLEITSNKVTGGNAKGETIQVSAKLPGFLIASDGDLKMNGNDSMTPDPAAFIATGGTLTFGGTPYSSGVAWVAADGIGESKLNGTGDIVYNGGAVGDFGGDGKPILTAIDELR
jgi:hypothetical protein